MPRLHYGGKTSFHAYHNGTLWASRGRKVLRSDNLGESFEVYAKIPDKLFGGVSTLADRFLRTGVHDILPLGEESILVVTRSTFHRYHAGKLVNSRHLERVRRSTRSSLCILSDGVTILHGEYWNHSDRPPVRIFVSRDQGLSWDTLWQSNSPHPKHVHFVTPSEFDPHVAYFGTGDYNHEPGIFKIDTRNGVTESLGSDAQEWRAVSILQHRRGLTWGMDCEFSDSYILNYELETGAVEFGKKLPGPAYYTTIDSSGTMYMATTVEERKQHRAQILSSQDGKTWETVAHFKKDPWHSRLFGYGTIEFIRGQEHLEELFINLRGLYPKQP